MRPIYLALLTYKQNLTETDVQEMSIHCRAVFMTREGQLTWVCMAVFEMRRDRYDRRHEALSRKAFSRNAPEKDEESLSINMWDQKEMKKNSLKENMLMGNNSVGMEWCASTSYLQVWVNKSRNEKNASGEQND